MAQDNKQVLEGIFAVSKPAFTSSAEILQRLQSIFATSQTFAPLLHSQPKRPSKGDDQVFRIGHGGTLDPLAAGVLIVGIGRGTKYLHNFLACNKTYETTVLFGTSTDTYDCTGVVSETATSQHVTRELVEQKLTQFRGTIQQAPPLYSALKINGIKACEYARRGEQLPRPLESREMEVDECMLMEWLEPGQHDFKLPGDPYAAPAPAARIRLSVSSGFYVRSFAHDLGLSCDSRSHMVSLTRTRQADFTMGHTAELPNLIPALNMMDLDAGEVTWGPILQPQLESWISAHPLVSGHVDGRSRNAKDRQAAEKECRPRQRFRGEYVAETKKQRIEQQGGKYKGKWGPKKRNSENLSDVKKQATITLAIN